MRSTFSNAIVSAARADSRILLLTGDHGYALFDSFRNVVPRQFINAGVAEQNMVGVAAGLAKAGFRPIVYGLSAFVPIRVLEQIKLDVCYERLPVIFIGDGAGVVYSSLGSSHQSTEDIAALRAVPHIGIMSPADEREMTYVLAHALRFTGPVYIRIGKADLGTIHGQVLDQPLGDLIPVLRPGSVSRAIIATGSMVKTALTIAEKLLHCSVWSVPSIRPFNRRQVEEIAKHAEILITVEEHQATGGLGGLIAEIVAEMKSPRARVIRLGVAGRFSERCGSYAYLMKEHGLDWQALLAHLSDQGVVPR